MVKTVSCSAATSWWVLFTQKLASCVIEGTSVLKPDHSSFFASPCHQSSLLILILISRHHHIIIIIPCNPPPCLHLLCDNPLHNSVMAAHNASPAASSKRRCVCNWGAEHKNLKKLLNQAGNILLTWTIPIKRGSDSSDDISRSWARNMMTQRKALSQLITGHPC
jgi:hypothetical protein